MASDRARAPVPRSCDGPPRRPVDFARPGRRPVVPPGTATVEAQSSWSPTPPRAAWTAKAAAFDIDRSESGGIAHGRACRPQLTAARPGHRPCSPMSGPAASAARPCRPPPSRPLGRWAWRATLTSHPPASTSVAALSPLFSIDDPRRRAIDRLPARSRGSTSWGGGPPARSPGFRPPSNNRILGYAPASRPLRHRRLRACRPVPDVGNLPDAADRRPRHRSWASWTRRTGPAL